MTAMTVPTHSLIVLARQNFQTSQYLPYFCTAEFNFLFKRGVFTIVLGAESPSHCIYNVLFVETIKNEENPNTFEKRRFAVQDFDDKKTEWSPVIPPSNAFHYIYCYFCLHWMTISFFIRDVSHTYFQSETLVHRPIFVRLPKMLYFSPRALLRVERFF